MRLCIPKLGDQLILKRDWTFDLYLEDRNLSLCSILEGRKLDWWQDFIWNNASEGYILKNSKHTYPVPFTIQCPALLSVERIYIRKGAEEFNSVTFRVIEAYDDRLIGKGPYAGKKCRFWAKLDDVNKMEIEWKP